MPSPIFRYLSSSGEERTERLKSRVLAMSREVTAPSSSDWFVQPLRTPLSEFGFRSSTKRSGSVKWFNMEKGYGFIASDNSEKDVFMYTSDLRYPHPRLRADRDRAEEIDNEAESKFALLATRWRKETSHVSFAVQQAMCPAYQQIIGMGMQAVPLILRELEKEPAHWFWALAAITGENPVPSEHAGNIAEMTKDWVLWGRSRGYC